MICRHQFFKIDSIAKPGNTPSSNVFGASAGCILCGQVRLIYSDGELKISAIGSGPIEEDPLADHED